MKKRFLCDDCKWSWRSCGFPGYPNATECIEYESKITSERYIPDTPQEPADGLLHPILAKGFSEVANNKDETGEHGRVWRGDRYWDSKKGWRKPNLLIRLLNRLSFRWGHSKTYR